MLCNVSSQGPCLSMNRTHLPYNCLLELVNYYLVFSCAATLLCNGVLVLAYVRVRSLRTCFNAYILNLSIAEILMACTGMPGAFARAWLGFWPLSGEFCIFFQYCMDVFGSAIRYGHLLIAGNRSWAVSFPLHYKRNYKDARVPIFAIIGMWIFVNMLHLPILVPAGIWPIQGDKSCIKNTAFQKTRATVVEVIGFAGVEVVIIVMCAFTAYKLMQKTLKMKLLQSSTTFGKSIQGCRITPYGSHIEAGRRSGCFSVQKSEIALLTRIVRFGCFCFAKILVKWRKKRLISNTVSDLFAQS